MYGNEIEMAVLCPGTHMGNSEFDMGPIFLIQSNLTQSNPWMNPIHVQLWGNCDGCKMSSGLG